MILVVPVESFLTKFTNVWPGVAVYRLVLAQSRQLPESFAASLAFKVSLVGVRWQMPHQRVLMPELLRTWIVNVKLSTDSRKFRTVLFFFQIFPFLFLFFFLIFRIFRNKRIGLRNFVKFWNVRTFEFLKIWKYC